MKRILALFLSLSVFISMEFVLTTEVNAEYQVITSDIYNTPSVTPKTGEHPRVLFTSSDISVIKANFSKSANSNAYSNFSLLIDDDNYSIDSLLGTKPENSTEELHAKIEAKAFDYAINGNKENGYEAINGILDYLSKYEYVDERHAGYVVFLSAEVYDWCHNLITDSQKEMIVTACIELAKLSDCKYPPVTSKQNPIASHGAEAFILRDMFAFAIAVYDEYPDIYEYIGSYIEKEYVPPRNDWYASSSVHQGSAYGPHRFQFDMWSAWLYRSMSGGKSLYSSDMQYAMYQFLYYTVADGQYFTEGDDTPRYTSYTAGRVGDHMAMWLASNYFNDKYLKAEQIRNDKDFNRFVYTYNSKTPVQFLIINNPDIEPGDMNDLPKTKYFGYPNGIMIAKTGWDNNNINSDHMSVYMRIGQEYMGNHQHLDFGTFQIYYKGMLTASQGMYRYYGSEHDFDYNKETVSHNGLLIYDPNETFLQSKVNSGGQRRTYTYLQNHRTWKNSDSKYGKVTAWAYDENNDIPEYSYISGDITDAYSDKVSEVKRSMLFMPDDNENIPGLFFVMDKIVSADKAYKKTFILQSMLEPEVTGNTTIMKRTHKKNSSEAYNGKLTVQTLFPKNPVIEKLGGAGYQWYAGRKNILPLDNDGNTLLSDSILTYGWGKVLISPSSEQKEDYFLNAMYMSDADNEYQAVAQAVETETFLGAELEDKIALFAKASTLLNGEYDFSFNNNAEVKDFIITGLADGNWQVYENGIEKGIYHTEGHGNLIRFKSEADYIKIKYISLIKPEIDLSFNVYSQNNREIKWSKVNDAKGYELIISDLNSNIVYEKSDISGTSVILPSETFSKGYDYIVNIRALSENSALSSEVASASLNVRYDGGNGTSEFPYIINDAESFSLMKDNCDRNIYFALADDITLTPLNYQPFEFSGVLKGWDKEKKCEKQRLITADLISGVFSELDTGTELRHLTLNGKIYDETATFKSRLGGFADSTVENAKDIIIDNCINNAVVKGRATYIGGIIGYAYNSKGIKISNSKNTAEIANVNGGTAYIGGIVGITSSSTVIEKCSNTANIGSGGNSVGGIVGCEEGSSISECYNTGCLSGKYTGGMLGRISTKTNITDCYDSGSSVSTNKSSVVGYLQKRDGAYESVITNYYSTNGYSLNCAAYEIKSGTGEGTFLTYNNCYHAGEADEFSGTTSLTDAQMKLKGSFKGFDFGKIWCIRDKSSCLYPMLKNNLQDGTPYFDSISCLSGKDFYKTELVGVFGFEKFNLLKDLPLIIVSAKIDKGNTELSEFGFELNGIKYPAENVRISDYGNYGMILYSDTIPNGENTLRSYAKCNDGTLEKYIYLDNTEEFYFSVAK